MECLLIYVSSDSTEARQEWFLLVVYINFRTAVGGNSGTVTITVGFSKGTILRVLDELMTNNEIGSVLENH